MAEESRSEPLTRRHPGENRGHRPAARVGSARLPDDVLRRALTAIRSGTDDSASPQDSDGGPRVAEVLPLRGNPLGFGPGADTSTQPIPVTPPARKARTSITATRPATQPNVATDRAAPADLAARPATPVQPAAPAAPVQPAAAASKTSQPRPSSAPGRPVTHTRRYQIAVAASVVTVFAVVAIAHSALGRSRSHSGAGPPAGQAAAVRGQAAAWIASQVSRSDIISCDPVMCAALRAHGFRAAGLLELTSSQGDPMHSAVIVATAAVRADLGTRLATVDAPGVIASFGPAAARIEVRVVAAKGAVAYRAALQSDLTQRRESAAELLHSGRLSVTGAARTHLAAGDVDARLLVTLAMLAAQHPIDVMSFGDGGPGASLTGSPYRSADVAPAQNGADPGFALSVLSFLHSQHPPFAVTRAGPVKLPGGRTAVRLEFAAPSPAGLLSGAGPAGS